MKSLLTILLLLAGLLCRADGVTEVRVLLLPMELTGPATANWLPDALRQNMVHELARSSRLAALSPKEALATSDPTTARAAGQNQGAQLVIFGSCQVAGADVRLMGQVLDVKSGKIAGVAKLTGSMRDVFGLEDQFAERCKRLSLEAIGEAQAKSDPVAAFARNLNDPVPVVKPGDALRRGPWPWDVQDPEVQWARDNVIYGRRTNTDYFTYPAYPYSDYGIWGGPVYGYGYGYGGQGHGWFRHPMNVANNASFNTFGRSYTSSTSVQWNANFHSSKGNVQVNVGR